MSVLTLMTTTVSRYQPNTAKDASGGYTVQPFLPYTQFQNVPANIEAEETGVNMHYQNRQTDTTHLITLPWDIQAKALDLLIEDSTGRKFKVNGYSEKTAGRGLAWVAKCVETT